MRLIELIGLMKVDKVDKVDGTFHDGTAKVSC
jgi:hypothetical protein